LRSNILSQIVDEPVREGILSAVGGTPLVRLEKVYPEVGFQLFAKLEALNPGGSIKDRPARAILEQAMKEGLVNSETVIVESSSGNMGIGLSQACCYYGLRLICVVDAKSARQNVAIMQAYGTEIDYVAEPDPVTGEFLQARLNRVQQLLREIGNSFWPNQYANVHNSGSHYRTTMHEIVTALDGKVDYVFCATSTCGTVRGCGEYVRDHGLSTKVVAVDAKGSLIFSDEQGKRLFPGMGAGLRPPLCNIDLIHECVLVSDLECVIGCRRMVRSEGLLSGASCGGVVAAVEHLKGKIPAGSTCVLILPDRGERYLDTVYSDDWIREHFGDVFHLFPKREASIRCVPVAC
jgi:2,3-diaminopropionate biosynthesis protein SbnA